MKKVKLTQLYSNHDNVRTKEVVGEPIHLPKIGERFVMLASPLDPNKSIRVLSTSRIIRLDKTENIFTIETENSVYQIEFDYKPKTWEV